MAVRYLTGIVSDNDDPDKLGKLRLIIPGLFHATEVYPLWVPYRPAAGSGPGAAGAWFVPPVDAIVVVEVSSANQVHWSGGQVGAVNTPPEFLTANYPRRSGFTSPAGGHSIALDDDVGLLILSTDPTAQEGPALYMALDGSEDEFKVGTIAGGTLTLNATQFVAMTPGSHTLVMDDANGIVLSEAGGGEFLSIAPGLLKIAGADLAIIGGTVNMVGAGGVTITNDLTGIAPTDRLVVEGFLTDLAAALPEMIAGIAAAGLPSPNTAALLASINISLGAGIPYLTSTLEAN